jgi:hypothetical protein
MIDYQYVIKDLKPKTCVSEGGTLKVRLSNVGRASEAFTLHVDNTVELVLPNF